MNKEQLVNRIKIVCIVICAYLSVLSLAKIISLNGHPDIYYGGNYFGYNITAVLIFAMDIVLLKRWLAWKNKRLRTMSIIGGMLMSVLIVYGAYGHLKNDIFISAGETFLQFGCMIGIGFLAAPLFSELFLLLERASARYADRQPEADREVYIWKIKVTPGRIFLAQWLGLVLCYMPLFLAWWPGNFVFDARYQMANVITGDHSTHHPLIHTLMMGKAYELGQKIGDVSVGFQFYTLAQILILTSAFAYFLLYLYKRRAPKSLQIICFLWFALFPMHALFSITATKDVLCAAFFLYFMVFTVRYFVDKETFKWYSYLGMVSTGVLLCLFRNNAMYAVIASCVLIAVMIKGLKNKGKTLLILVAIYLFTTLANDALIAYTNAQDKDSYRETFSVPLQCLARVASYRKDDLDRQLYDEICLYIREQDIPKYNPYLSDPIKTEANEVNLRTNTLNFFKLWVKVGLQFPDEYIESIVTNTMGYWYPLNQGTYVSNDFALYHTLIGVGEEIEKRTQCQWAYDLYSAFFYHKNFYYVPLLGYSFRNAPYIWTILIALLWCIYKKDKKAIKILFLPLVYFFTCLCGPWAALRYIYCLVVCAPLLIYIMLSRKREIE